MIMVYMKKKLNGYIIIKIILLLLLCMFLFQNNLFGLLNDYIILWLYDKLKKNFKNDYLFLFFKVFLYYKN